VASRALAARRRVDEGDENGDAEISGMLNRPLVIEAPILTQPRRRAYYS
jgi:hypothetical protein